MTSLSTIFQLYRGLSVLSVEETVVRGENKLPAKIHFANCYCNVINIDTILFFSFQNSARYRDTYPQFSRSIASEAWR
jgi:hypothetical protein